MMNCRNGYHEIQTRGRGAGCNPPNRFGERHFELDLSELEHEADYLRGLENPITVYIPDRSLSIVTKNESPDIPFDYSINPYRGCSHGCSYCYARPYHEYLGLNAGLDFETKILYKPNAPELFRRFLQRKSWFGAPIVLSGVTDCYQPAEREFRITRSCLEVALESNQPISLITKNALILRDVDIIGEMASRNLVHVGVSITTLDPNLSRILEPRTSAPHARLDAIRKLTQASVPVRVMTAPIIPGVNDNEIPQLLQAAAEAGAIGANYVLLRLPLSVAPMFMDWLARHFPDRKSRVEAWIRDMRHGKLNHAQFGERMKGAGEMAEQINNLYRIFARRHRLNRHLPKLDAMRFRPPSTQDAQQTLF